MSNVESNNRFHMFIMKPNEDPTKMGERVASIKKSKEKLMIKHQWIQWWEQKLKSMLPHWHKCTFNSKLIEKMPLLRT